MVEKYKQDGKVAVLVSAGLSAGYSTWNTDFAEDLLFNKEYVKLILENKFDILESLLKSKYKEGYFNGVWDLRVKWVSEGSLFRIHEHDGLETLVLLNEEKYFCA